MGISGWARGLRGAVGRSPSLPSKGISLRRPAGVALVAVVVVAAVVVLTGMSDPREGHASSGDVAAAILGGGPRLPLLARDFSEPEQPQQAPQVVSLRIDSASISPEIPVEPRHTEVIDDTEYLALPSDPGFIAWYYRFGRPGTGGSNSVFSAHVNYYGYGGRTPFAGLSGAAVGDDVYVGLDDGRLLRFTVSAAEIYGESVLVDLMTALVFPQLGPDRERVTLVTCAGNFIPYWPGGPGQYDSRLIVTADRLLD